MTTQTASARSIVRIVTHQRPGYQGISEVHVFSPDKGWTVEFGGTQRDCKDWCRERYGLVPNIQRIKHTK